MDGLNPNFIVYYEPESGDFIKVSFNNFTTNNIYCYIHGHILLPND